MNELDPIPCSECGCPVDNAGGEMCDACIEGLEAELYDAETRKADAAEDLARRHREGEIPDAREGSWEDRFDHGS